MKYLIPKIEYFFRLVKRFWLIILTISVISGVIGGVVARIIYKPEYQITQAFTIELAEHPEANMATVSETQLTKTVPALLSSNTFIEYMAPIIKEAGVSGRFKVTSLESSNIFYITSSARNNKDAQIIINKVQEHYADLANKVIGESEMRFLAPPSYKNLPINTPHYTLSALACLLAAGIIILAIFALFSFWVNTVTEPSDIESEIKPKCLANIHRVYKKQRSKKENTENLELISDDNADFYYKKSISTLSSNVNSICAKNGYKSILITSTISGEGKSTIALNLALDLADKGKKVVIVDFDLRNPSIAEYMGLKNIEYPLSNAMKTGDYQKAITKTDFSNLYFCGNTAENTMSFDNIGDDIMEDIVANLKKEFDYVIIDTAPVGLLGDAISVSNFADCFLYVITYNYIRKNNVINCISTLDEKNNMIGFVLNNK